MLGAILGSLAGSAVTGLFNSKQSDKNRDFQEEMSNTAHQREVQDLMAAGLNPMLSAKLGGASSPGGSTASMPDLGSTLNNAMTVASNSAKQRAEVDLIKAQTTTAETQAALNQAAAVKTAADTAVSNQSAATAAFELERRQYLKDTFNEWWVQGRSLDTQDLQNTLKRYESNRDYNAVRALDQLAIRYGYSNFREAADSTAFLNDLKRYELTATQLPKARAEADFYNTPWGREIAPFINSASGGLDLLGSGLSIGRRILGPNFGRLAK